MIWIARYRDGTGLRQFNPDSSENLFKDINQEKLVEFSLIDEDIIYSVSLEDGIFNINGLKLGFDEISKDNNLRLIYFKRVKQNMGSFGAESSIEITYNIGYQTNVRGKKLKN